LIAGHFDACFPLPAQADCPHSAESDMPRTSFPKPHEQHKIEKLLARLAEMKRNPKLQVVKRASA